MCPSTHPHRSPTGWSPAKVTERWIPTPACVLPTGSCAIAGSLFTLSAPQLACVPTAHSCSDSSCPVCLHILSSGQACTSFFKSTFMKVPAYDRYSGEERGRGGSTLMGPALNVEQTRADDVRFHFHRKMNKAHPHLAKPKNPTQSTLLSKTH